MLIGLSVSGVGKSKKLAKRNAASAMLQTLKQGTIMPDADGQTPEDGYAEDLVVSRSKSISFFSKLCLIQQKKPIFRLKIGSFVFFALSENDPTKASYSNLKEGKRIPTLTPQASQKITQFYTQMKNTPGKIYDKINTNTLLLSILFISTRVRFTPDLIKSAMRCTTNIS